MTKSATDLMQEVIFSAIVDSMMALKKSAGGVPNSILRDVNSMHQNSTFDDLPKPVQDAIKESVRASFIALKREGYTVAPAAAVTPVRRNVNPTRSPNPRATKRSQ